jgi:hypothetical protein
LTKANLDLKQFAPTGHPYGRFGAKEVSKIFCRRSANSSRFKNAPTTVTEPPPTFTWTHPHLGDLSSNEDFTVLHEEYQGGSTTTLVINHAKNTDAGTYSLTAENRNGKEKVDLDLIVLDTLPECGCDMYKRADKMCTCTHSYTG